MLCQMRFIWRDTLYSQSMLEEACCWFVVLLHSEKMLRMVYSVMRVGGASTVKHCCRKNWWTSAVWWERGEIKGREGKAALSAREKLKGMKYSTIKLCGEFLIRRIKHLYAPRKESEMNKEREPERKRDAKWKAVEGGMDSECIVSKSLRNTLSEQFFSV